MEDYGTMKDASHKRPHIVGLHSRKCPVIGKSKETEGRLVVARGCAEGLGSGWYRAVSLGMIKIYELRQWVCLPNSVTVLENH